MRQGLSGASTSRTFMLTELSTLLDQSEDSATPDDYRREIVENNILLKPSLPTRNKTFAYLRDRYALDPAVPIFRILRLLWQVSPSDRPLQAMLVAISRDDLARATVDRIVAAAPGTVITSAEFSADIERGVSKLLTPSTLETSGERMTSSWRQAGHLRISRSGGVRQPVTPSLGSAVMALLFGHLCGLGGQRLLASPWAAVLDASPGDMQAYAEQAGQIGLVEYRHAGGVLQITFNRLLKDGQ